VSPAILDDRSIYPDAATMQRLYTAKARDAATQRTMNRLWTRIKTGR
jgi:putrescine transport system substrate-binding protein